MIFAYAFRRYMKKIIDRNLLRHLVTWKNSGSKLPMILRGARQVGKTTLVHEFGKGYDQFLYFDLEKEIDRRLFDQHADIEKLVQILFLARGKAHNPAIPTLLFFDEIQEKISVIESLRYFKEDFPYLDVIVTGSLLDFGLRTVSRTPVGRVEYAELHPLNFREFLDACSKQDAIEILDKVPFSPEFHDIFLALFHEYITLGGMPGIVSAYLRDRNLSRIMNLYSGIVESYKDDVEKYATSDKQRNTIRHIMNTAPYQMEARVNLNNFGQSSFRTQDIKAAMSALTKARYLDLIYPTSQTQPPIIPALRKRPRLHFLDVGLLNYQLGLHQELLMISNLNHLSRGKVMQQIVNQEIKAQRHLPGFIQAFWVREQRGATAEVDILFPYQDMLIPIEVKSGATGRLRSLHEFIDRSPHDFAVRIYGGKLSIDTLTTRQGKKYRLLNLPYFLTGWINSYLDWFTSQK